MHPKAVAGEFKSFGKHPSLLSVSKVAVLKKSLSQDWTWPGLPLLPDLPASSLMQRPVFFNYWPHVDVGQNPLRP